MLFNAPVFLFAFLPVCVLGFYLLGARVRPEVAILWLVIASLFFYGWWDPVYVLLIGASIGFNYALGLMLTRRKGVNARRILLGVGACGNLGALAYFKYAGFFLLNLNIVFDNDWSLGEIILPLAISFFTFQQIAFLVDCYRGQAREPNFLHYCLFVCFFPQLIAGPIVHHAEMLPQFARRQIYRFRSRRLAIGLSILAIGLFKKVVIADGMAIYANPVFSAAEAGTEIGFLAAWSGALAYTFQLYFDFSGYADMAIGLGALFGIRLPLNFYSPYKANSIIDFWRRWHMTLARFLRDYLYVPLGGNRRGPARRGVNLMITMLLGGLWHGAGWTFVIWGGLHGLYLIANHFWRHAKARLAIWPSDEPWWERGLARAVTFFGVVLAWVFFRAETLDGAMNMVDGMLGLNGLVIPARYAPRLGSFAEVLQAMGLQFGLVDLPYKGTDALRAFVVLFIVVWFAPNTSQIMRRYRPHVDAYRGRGEGPARWLGWRPTPAWGIAYGLLLSAAATAALYSETAEFLYFQF